MPSDDIPAITKTASKVVAGVETHKDLHVAAIVDTHDHVMATESFASTRHGYNCMLTWMRSYGALDGVGIECARTYGAGLSRYLQHAGITVLEVTAPDKSDRRRQGKDDTLDAIDAANAAFSGVRTFTPKSRDGMIEALRVLKTCRKTAISARRVASAYPERYCERPRSPAGAASFHEPDAADPDPGRMAARSDGQRECIIALSDPTDIARTPVSRVDR